MLDAKQLKNCMTSNWESLGSQAHENNCSPIAILARSGDNGLCLVGKRVLASASATKQGADALASKQGAHALASVATKQAPRSGERG